jgi:hypothetical protein
MDETDEKSKRLWKAIKSLRFYLSNKKFITIFFCILISTALWFLNALGKTYTTSIFYPVRYVDMPKNKVLSNEPPAKLELKVTAPGYTIVSYRILMTYSPIELNLDNVTRNVKPTPDGYLIRTESLIKNISSQVSTDITITSVNPDYITFRFDSLETRTIKIKPIVETTFKQQFNLAAPIKVMPDNAQVKGIRADIDTIRNIYTEKKSFSSLNKTLEHTLRLIAPANTEIQPIKVKIEIPVDEFTEKELMVPVTIINNPVTQEIKLFPSAVKMTFLTSLAQFKTISASDFKVVADYTDIKQGVLALPIKIEKRPDYLLSLKYTPETVEYLIERKR